MRSINLIIVCTYMIVLLAIVSMYQFHEPGYAQHNTCKIEDLVENPEAIDKAILKMGPMYYYTVDIDGTLRVNKGDGKWLILKY